MLRLCILIRPLLARLEFVNRKRGHNISRDLPPLNRNPRHKRIKKIILDRRLDGVGLSFAALIEPTLYDLHSRWTETIRSILLYFYILSLSPFVAVKVSQGSRDERKKKSHFFSKVIPLSRLLVIETLRQLRHRLSRFRADALMRRYVTGNSKWTGNGLLGAVSYQKAIREWKKTFDR